MLSLFAAGLSAMSFFGWRKRKAGVATWVNTSVEKHGNYSACEIARRMAMKYLLRLCNVTEKISDRTDNFYSDFVTR